MKKKIFALIAIAAFGFASCQKPENPNNEPEPEPTPEPTPAELVAGVYDGQLSILLGDFPFGDPTDQQVELIAGEDGTVTLSITDLSVMNGEFTFDQISLEGCPATENEDGSISVSTEGTVTLTFVYRRDSDPHLRERRQLRHRHDRKHQGRRGRTRPRHLSRNAGRDDSHRTFRGNPFRDRSRIRFAGQSGIQRH